MIRSILKIGNTILPFFLAFLLMWFFWTSAVSTTWARINAIQTVEPYAFAVHEQLMRNFDATGQFSQTIHSGYDDAWTWSGHRALTLPALAKVYGLHPSALWLSQIMILCVLLGSIPTGLLCQKKMKSKWGFFLGVFVYLVSPATIALSLQDYQDLCLALPCLSFAMWAFSTGNWFLAICGAIIGVAAREECVPITIAIACIMWPYKKKTFSKNDSVAWLGWVRNILIAVILVGTYVWWAEKNYPIATSGHDMPLQNAVASLGSGQIFLEGWLYRYRFYALVWVPLGTFAILSPLVSLPGIALCLLHMTVPDGHGVDRSWSLHCHHMAPAVAFSCSATAIGLGRLLRYIRRIPFGRFFQISIFIGVCSWSSWWWWSWSEYYNLVRTYKIIEPEWSHPAWKLLGQLDEKDVPIVSKKTSIAASHFLRSYTFDESLYSKEPHRGLSVATHILFDQRREKVKEWIERIPGYEVLDEEYPFVLATWNLRRLDSGFRPKFSSIHAWVGPYNKGSDIPGIPPHEKRLQVRMDGSFPIIRLWNQPPLR